MADEQPEDHPRDGSGGEASTLDAPVRWSGAAAVPPPVARRGWWSRRRGVPPVDATEWGMTPPVDPWADQETPWDPMTLSGPPLPPTLQGPPVPPVPPTLLGPPVPPTLPGPPVPPANQGPPIPPANQGPPVPPADQGPPSSVAPAGTPAQASQRSFFRRRRREKPAPPAQVNRLPVQARANRPAPAAAPVPWPAPPAWRPPGPPPGFPARGLPPGGGPQGPYRPLPPPRRRHWSRRIALFTLLGVVCCCGLPVAYLAGPGQQYPVRAVLPADVGDLTKRDDAASREAVARLTAQVRAGHRSVDQVFAGVYGDGYGKRVTVFGATGFRLTPGADVRTELNHLSTRYAIRGARSYDTNQSGVYLRCGVGTSAGTPVVVCAWADHGSLAAVVLTRRSLTDSARLTGVLRGAVLKRA